MKIVAIVNGNARGKGRILRSFKRHPQDGIKVFVVKKAGDIALFAQKAIELVSDLLIVCGSDSMLNTVVNELMTVPFEKRPPLAIFPLNAANDYSRVVRHRGLEDTVERLAKEGTITVDITHIEMGRKTRYALNMVTCGMSANIVRSVNKRERWLSPNLNFFSATALWLLYYRPPKIEISVGSYFLKKEFHIVAMGKGKFVGSGLGLCPQAVLNNGKLAATLLSKARLTDFLRYFSTLKAGKAITNDPRALYTSATHVEIKVAEGKMSVEADGEYLGTLRKGQSLSASVAPAAIRLVKPL